MPYKARYCKKLKKLIYCRKSVKKGYSVRTPELDKQDRATVKCGFKNTSKDYKAYGHTCDSKKWY